jgi:hypothetical protein
MTNAIENVLEDGAITAEQADQWLARLEQIGERAPGIFSPGSNPRGRMQSYRKGFATGFRLSRQMMLNHEYIDAALVESLDISVGELQEMRAEEGLTWQTYVEENGFGVDELAALRIEVITNAVEADLADGAITQEQADWLLERMQNFEEYPGWFGQTR